MSNILVLHRRIDAPVNHSSLGRHHSRKKHRHTRPQLPPPLTAGALVLRSSSLLVLIYSSARCLYFLAYYWLGPPSHHPTIHKVRGTGTNPHEGASRTPCTLLLPCLTSAAPTLPGVVEAKRNPEAALLAASTVPLRVIQPRLAAPVTWPNPGPTPPRLDKSTNPPPILHFLLPIRCCPQNLLTPLRRWWPTTSSFTPLSLHTLHLSVTVSLSLSPPQPPSQWHDDPRPRHTLRPWLLLSKRRTLDKTSTSSLGMASTVKSSRPTSAGILGMMPWSGPEPTR